jgi:hypothetical protein
MVFAASTHTSLSGGSLALVTCFCAVSLAFGIAHYRGWHRSWMYLLPSEASFFLPAWFGAFGLLAVLCILAAKLSAWLALVLALPTAVAFAIMLMSMVWLPPRLLPSWYRDSRDRRRASSPLAR